MSGIGVTESAKLLVVAADECGAGVNSVGGFDDRAIDAVGEFGHGVGLVDVGTGKDLSADAAENSPALQ